MENNINSIHPQKNNLSSTSCKNSRKKWLIAVSWFVCIVLGAWQAWNARYHMNADGISYLDIGDTYFRGDWKNAVNAYWSPLYSWLLGSAMHFLKPSPYNEFPVVHLVNFIIYLFTLGCFHFLLLQLIQYHQFRQDKTPRNGSASFPEWAWIAIGYSLFFYSSLNMITVYIVTPDMCVAAFVYLACGILLRIYRGANNNLTFALLGAVLGFGYLAKSVMFPLAFIFLSISFFSIGNFRKVLPRFIIALIIFLSIAGPFIIAISHAKGRVTFGDTGKFNYYHVSKFKIGRYWDDTLPGNGTFKHTPRQIFNVPKVYEFGTPIMGTYPIWYDPSYWYDGLEIRFNLKNQLRVFQSTIISYYHIFFPDYSIMFITIPILFLMGRRKWLIVKDIAEQWSLLVPPIMALSIYFMVSADPRYVAPFISLLWLGIFSGIRLPDSEESRRLLRYVTIVIVLAMMITSIRQLIKDRHPLPDNTQWQVADAIKRMGVLPGDKVASIGYSHPHFWARLAKVRIVAEIPDEDVNYFWKTNSEVQFKVLDTFGRTGAKIIVTKIMPGHIPPVPRQKIANSDSYFDWQQIANSDFYVYTIPPANAVSPASPVSAFDEISPEYFKTDVGKLIEIRKPEDVAVFRNRLIRFLWGSIELPKSLPSIVTKDFKDVRYGDISNLKRIDKLIVRMDFGLESHIYHFIPETSNNKVILFHQGHEGDFYYSKEEIAEFLNNGYSVVAFCMPLRGLNNQPTVYLPRQGFFELKWDHDFMKLLSPVTGHPIKYFIEPVVIALNYLKDRYDYNQISMTGISGGGWTTTLSAAVDTRIKRSFPVAGTLPIYLRSNSRNDWGDYEQTEPKLYNTVNYLELYILGTYGSGRKQLQILNKYDTCCFEGIKWQTYKDIVRSRVFELGLGEYDLFMDDTHKHHQISKAAMKRILNELQNR